MSGTEAIERLEGIISRYEQSYTDDFVMYDEDIDAIRYSIEVIKAGLKLLASYGEITGEK